MRRMRSPQSGQRVKASQASPASGSGPVAPVELSSGLFAKRARNRMRTRLRSRARSPLAKKP